MRGEHPVFIVLMTPTMGSSPHARGTLAENSGVERSKGIIPACAGNTSKVASCFHAPKDHPRMRGEHACMSGVWAVQGGSSPHARGTLAAAPHAGGNVRIIPACAGNTPTGAASMRRPWDHPRMRGEHGYEYCTVHPEVGSSPHARGTLIDASVAASIPGIIPACAGNTSLGTRLRCRDWDHPRMRGEHTCSPLPCRAGRGSSPHARGTRMVGHQREAERGIIPACAGNTEYAVSEELGERDHPRMRGEHLVEASYRIEYSGSSPHARGTPFQAPGLLCR